MRSRNIKPSFFTNDELAEVEPLGRILFAGLWCAADREGRLEDRPKRLKAQLLPFDNCDVDQLLDQLQRGGFILRYEAAGNRYIQVLAFAKHQNPHVKEALSTIPAPPQHSASTVLAADDASGQHQTSTVLAPENPEQAGLIPDSLNLIPDSLSPATGYSPEFENAWAAYPRRSGGNSKQAAWNAWRARLKQGCTAAEMIAGTEAYAAYATDKGIAGTEFVKQASTFYGPGLHFREDWKSAPAKGRANGAHIGSQDYSSEWKAA